MRSVQASTDEGRGRNFFNAFVTFGHAVWGGQVLARKYRNADAKRLGGTNERKLLFVNVLFDERAKVRREFGAIYDPEQGRHRPVRLGRISGRKHAIRRQEKSVLTGEYVELHGAENTAVRTP